MGKNKKIKIKGEVSEWFKVQISKICGGASPPRVRIPPSPFLLDALLGKGFRNKFGMTMLCLSECKNSVWCDVKIYSPIYINCHPELVSGSDIEK